MPKWLAIILGSALLMTFQAAFFSAWPAPADSVDLMLVLIIGFVASFQPRYAYAAAATGGLVQDILSSSPPGLHISLALLTASVVNLLFLRVITNLSLISFAALNAVGFVFFRVSAAAMGLLVDLTLGRTIDRSFAAGAVDLFWGMAVQITASALLLLVFKYLAGLFRTRFFFSEHV